MDQHAGSTLVLLALTASIVKLMAFKICLDVLLKAGVTVHVPLLVRVVTVDVHLMAQLSEGAIFKVFKTKLFQIKFVSLKFGFKSFDTVMTSLFFANK